MKQFLVGVLVLGAGSLGLSAQAPAAAKATVKLAPTANQTARGEVTFTAESGGVHVVGSFSGLVYGEHGFHVHEKGDCSSGDAMSAGGHLNPSGKPHGPPTGEHHAGDLPAIRADGAGIATIDARVRGLAGGPTEFAGKALVVHVSPDDYTTQPTGNSGARIACGVIAATPPRDASGQALPMPQGM